MMISLFLIYLLCLGLIFLEKRKIAFTLLALNLIFSLFMLLYHSTDNLNLHL